MLECRCCGCSVAGEAETLRLPPLVLSVSVEADTTEVMEVAELMEVTVADVEAETFDCPGAVCVGGSRPTEVAELPMLAERAVAVFEAVTLRLPPTVLSVSVSVAADSRTEVAEAAILTELTVADVEAATLRPSPLLLSVSAEPDRQRWRSCRCLLSLLQWQCLRL